ncbi:MAG TPA: thioredoxin family protein [Anaerolineae bacterium]|nr:thioredoxin family protein [Anaerolineae bacterium]
MTPVVDGLEQQYGGQVVFKRINALEGDGPEVMRAYRIPGHPALLVFNQARVEVQRFIGPQPAGVVQEVLRDVVEERQ